MKVLKSIDKESFFSRSCTQTCFESRLSETFSFSVTAASKLTFFQAPKRSPDDFSTVDIFIAFLEVQQATMARAVILVDSSIMHEQVA